MGKSYEKQGKYLRECREIAGLLQKEVAQKMGVDQGRLSRWESGSVLIPKKYFPLLTETIGTDEEKLQALCVGSNLVLHEDNILPLLKELTRTTCKKVSFDDLLFLMKIQESLPQPMTETLIEQLLTHRQS